MTSLRSKRTLLSNPIQAVGVPSAGQIPQYDGTKWSPTSQLPVTVSYETAPQDHGFDIWSFNPEYTTNGTTIGVGRVVAARMWVPMDCTITQLGVHTRGGGTTGLANCYLALFSKTGVRLGVSADQSSFWGDGNNRLKMAALTPDTAGSLALQGGVGEYVYAAYVVGTNSTTVLTMAANAQQNSIVANTGVQNPTDNTQFANGFIPNSFLSVATGLTAMPSSIDMSTAGITPGAKFWFGAT